MTRKWGRAARTITAIYDSNRISEIQDTRPALPLSLWRRKNIFTELVQLYSPSPHFSPLL